MFEKLIPIFCIVLSVIFLFLLGGCAHPSSKSDAGDVSANRELPGKPESSPDAQHARLIFKTDGAGIPVIFKFSNSAEDCEGFERIGSVFHSGREVLTPWVAKMTEGLAKLQGVAVERQKIVPSDTPVQIWTQSPTFNRPLALRFTPKGAKVYLVLDLLLNNRGDHVQQVFDITDAQQQIAVEAEHLSACTTIF